jgi:hypothetical protein
VKRAHAAGGSQVLARKVCCGSAHRVVKAVDAQRGVDDVGAGAAGKGIV